MCVGGWEGEEAMRVRRLWREARPDRPPPTMITVATAFITKLSQET